MEGEGAGREACSDDEDRADGEGADGGKPHGHARLRVREAQAALIEPGEVREETFDAGIPVGAAGSSRDTEIGVEVAGVGGPIAAVLRAHAATGLREERGVARLGGPAVVGAPTAQEGEAGAHHRLASQADDEC